MKIAFVGGGAATLIAANLLKKDKPNIDVVIVDKKPRLGRKLSMTGNGKCNLSPIKDDINAYNHPDFVSALFNDIPLDEYLNTLRELGVPTYPIREQGHYPISENASNVVDILIDSLIRRKVKIINDEVIDYKGTTLRLKINGELIADKVVFAIGGKSYGNTGSDGSFFSVLNKHGYIIKPLKASLCPIKVKENIKPLFGARNHASISLINNGEIIYQEDGEIMFKKDALSGIAIMNMSSFIARQPGEYQIKADFLANKEFSADGFATVLDTLLGYVSRPIADYLLRLSNISPQDLTVAHKTKLQQLLSNLVFTYESLYGFESAQVTSGGLDLAEIDANFQSNRERGLYFIGEMLDIDGLCGGYNLRFAITSGIKMVKSL